MLIIQGIIALIILIGVAALDGALAGVLDNKIQNKISQFFVRLFIITTLLTLIIFFGLNFEIQQSIMYALGAYLFMHIGVLTGGKTN